jgi:hypothetical protein
MFRKPPITDNFHYTLHNSVEHKLAAYRFKISRMHHPTVLQERKEKRMNKVLHNAYNNGYLCSTKTQLNNKMKNKIQYLTTPKHNIICD